MTWTDGPWLGVDTETTGVDPLAARLVTACVAYRSATDSGWTREWLADAGCELIPDAATAVHGITTEKAHAEGRPVIDVAEEVRELLQKAWAQGVPVAGMNVCYDLTLLNTELVRAGHRELSIDGPVLDPLVLDRAADKYRRGSRKLPHPARTPPSRPARTTRPQTPWRRCGCCGGSGRSSRRSQRCRSRSCTRSRSPRTPSGRRTCRPTCASRARSRTRSSTRTGRSGEWARRFRHEPLLAAARVRVHPGAGEGPRRRRLRRLVHPCRGGDAGVSRALLAVVVIAAGVTTLVTHHHKRPGVAHPQRPVDLRASRSHVREPLPAVQSRTVHDKGVPMLRVLSRSARPASDSGILSDVTMYCATGSRNADGRWPELGDVAVMDRSIPFGTRVLIDGNTYTVRDWIGSGSEFDIFGGNDASCERRALDYGRRRVHVVVHR